MIQPYVWMVDPLPGRRGASVRECPRRWSTAEREEGRSHRHPGLAWVLPTGHLPQLSSVCTPHSSKQCVPGLLIPRLASSHGVGLASFPAGRTLETMRRQRGRRPWGWAHFQDHFRRAFPSIHICIAHFVSRFVAGLAIRIAAGKDEG